MQKACFIMMWLIFLQEWVPDDWEWAEPRLYKVGLGQGYLELPQGKFIVSVNKQNMLYSKSKNVGYPPERLSLTIKSMKKSAV